MFCFVQGELFCKLLIFPMLLIKTLIKEKKSSYCTLPVTFEKGHDDYFSIPGIDTSL